MEPVSFINDNLLHSGEELLYLTYFGSHLYGTANSESDVDYKGLYLPSKEDLLLKRARKSINWKSGNDNDKNSSEDVDIELWSIHYFMELIGKGDTGAIDLLFSPSNTDTVVYKDGKIDTLFDNPLSLFDPSETTSLVSYSYSQLKKYGLRGSRLGVLKNVYKYLTPIYHKDQETMETRLRYMADKLLKKFYDESYFFYKKINGQDALVVCGKTHLYSITMSEFYNRITREYKKYGGRSEEAEKNRGIDWKCVMHSYRCAFEMIELLKYGKVVFPLEKRDFLKRVKNAELDYNHCENEILELIEYVDRFRKSEDSFKGECDDEFVERLILSLYNE